MIDVLVVPAMLARPHQDGIFERARAEDQREQPDRPAGLESDVREEPMVAEADAETRRREHRGEKREMKPIQPKMPDVERDRGQRQRRSADEE